MRGEHYFVRVYEWVGNESYERWALLCESVWMSRKWIIWEVCLRKLFSYPIRLHDYFNTFSNKMPLFSRAADYSVLYNPISSIICAPAAGKYFIHDHLFSFQLLNGVSMNITTHEMFHQQKKAGSTYWGKIAQGLIQMLPLWDSTMVLTCKNMSSNDLFL